MRIVRYVFAALIVLPPTTNALAAELSYNCAIKAVYGLDDQGRLEPSGKDEQFRDERFSVSRLTGQIIGMVVPTVLATSTEVIRYGDSEWSFRAIAHYEKDIQLIVVEEFKSGETKPFFAASPGGFGIVTGLCK